MLKDFPKNEHKEIFLKIVAKRESQKEWTKQYCHDMGEYDIQEVPITLKISHPFTVRLKKKMGWFLV